MTKVVDLIGQIFGDWIIQRRSSSNKDGRACWLCECRKCGYGKVITGKSLRRKKATRCSQCGKAKDCLAEGNYGSLKVLERLENDQHGFANWLCRCEHPVQQVGLDASGDKILTTKSCDTLLEVLGIQLRSGQTECRACSSREGAKKNQKNLTGLTFERLTVITLDEVRSVEKQSRYWRCSCRCGAVVSVRQDGLTGGLSKSCGCLQRDVVKSLKRALFKISRI